MLRVVCAHVLELANKVEELGSLDLFEGVADLVEGRDAWWKLDPGWNGWESAWVGSAWRWCAAHVEVRRRRSAIAVLLLVLLVVGIGRAAVVVAVVHPQCPPVQLELVQVAHCRRRRVGV